jgi:uncharacterized protein (TIGR03083 family)
LTDTWDMIREERTSLAGALADLPEDKWNSPSLAPGWTVRDVVAHLIASATSSPGKFVGGMARAGFKFDKMANNDIQNIKSEKSNTQLVEQYTSLIDSHSAPPGPTATWLGETIVHGEDIFRSFGSYRDHKTEYVLAAADFYKNSNLLIGSKKRITGVTLRATDAEWSWGTGPEVSGPAVALVMAMTGRKVALDDLTGEGVAVMRAR